MVCEFAVLSFVARESAERPKAIAAFPRPIAIQREEHVDTSAYVYVPVEREYAEGVSVVHPPERQNALEVVIPPERREEAEVRIVAIALAPPEEREHAVVFFIRIELADRPEEIELVILAVTVPLVLRPNGAKREMVVAPRDNRPDDRPDRLAPVGERPQVHAVLDRARELHLVAAVQRSRGELLHLATAHSQERDNGNHFVECCQCGRVASSNVASFQFLHFVPHLKCFISSPCGILALSQDR